MANKKTLNSLEYLLNENKELRTRLAMTEEILNSLLGSQKDSALKILKSNAKESRANKAGVEKSLAGSTDSEIIANMQSVYDSMSDGLAVHEIIYDKSGLPVDYVITDVNPAFEKITRLKKTAITGRKVTEVYKLDEAPYLDIYAQVASTGVPSDFETYFHPLKKHFHVSVFSPEKGKFATIFQDITERKQTEEELHVTMRRFYLMLSGLKNGILLSDNSGSVEFVNQTYCDLFGLNATPTEFLNISADELITKTRNSYKDPGTAISRINEIIKDAKTVSGEDVKMSSGKTLLMDFIQITVRGEKLGRLWSFRDNTEKSLISETQNFLVNESGSAKEEEFFGNLARFLSVTLGMDYVCIDKLEGDNLTATTVAVFNEGKFDPDISYTLKDTPCGDVVGKTVCCFPKNVCTLFPHDQALIELQAESYIGITLWSFDGKPIGLIAVIGKAPLKEPHLAELVLKLVSIRAAAELERRQAESVLRENDKRFRTILNNSQYLIYRLNLQTGSFEYLSKSAEKVIGYPYDELIKLKAGDVLELVHPDDRKALKEFSNRLTETGIGTIEYRQRSKNGDYRWLSNFGSLVKDLNGQPLFNDGSIRDITEQKNSEEGLLKSEELLKSVLDNVNSGVALIDETGKFILYNPLFLKLFGLSEYSTIKNVNDQNWAEWRVFNENGKLLPVDEHPVRKAGVTGKRVSQQLVGVNLPSGGEIIWMLISAEPFFKSNGEIEKIICTYHDITDRQKAEKALLESEERLRISLNALDMGTWDLDLITGKAIHSLRHDQIFGYNELQPEWTFEMACRHMLPEYEPHFREAFETAKKTGVLNFEGKVVWPDGSIHWISPHGVVHYNSIGLPVRAVGVVADITERKDSEDALRQSEERLRVTLASIGDAVLTIDTTGCIVFLNQVAVTLTGWELNEAVGHPINDVFNIINEQTRLKADDIVQQVLSGCKVVGLTYDTVLIAKDGHQVPIEDSAAPIKDKTGKILGVILVFHDVTEKRRSQEELQIALIKYKTLFDNLPVGITTADENGQIIESNQLARTLLGLTAEEHTSRKISGSEWQLINSEGLPFPESEYPSVRAMKEKQPVENIEMGVVRSDKTISWINVSATPIPLPGYGVLIVYSDISKRKQVEDTLKRNDQKLKYHLENSPLAVIEWDKDFNIIQWSDEAEKIFGLTKDEVLGLPFDLLNIVYDDDIPRVKEVIDKLKDGRNLKIVSQIRNYTKNRDVAECIWHNSVLLDERGKMSSVLSLIQDITQLKNTERALIESRLNYKELLTNAKSIIIKMDINGILTYVNEFTTAFFGFTEEELVGNSVFDTIVHPLESTGRDLVEMGETIIGDPDTFSVNINENIKKNGEIVWIEWHNKALYDQDGNRSGHMAIGIDVTQKKKAEEALKNSERSLRSILNATKESIYMFDRDGIIIMSNTKGIGRLKRNSESEVVGHHFTEFMTKEIASRRQKKLDAVFKSGKPLEFEDQRGDKIFHHNFFPVFQDDKVLYVVTYSTDITAQKESELKLQESEHRFRTIAESVTVMISITKISDTKVTFANEPALKFFGFKKEDVIDKTLPDIFYFPDDRIILHDLLKVKSAFDNQEIKVKKSDGSSFWILSSARKINFMEEPCYLMVSIDITDTKNAQAELIRLNRTLNAHSKSSQMMMQSDNEFDYLDRACKIIIEDCGYKMVWIGYAEDGPRKSVIPVAYFGFDKGYIDQMKITWDESERGGGPTGMAIRTGKPSICRNMLTDPAFKPWKEAALKRGFASSLVLPLISEGKAFGSVSIYSEESDSFSESEINLLTDLADDLAYGVGYIRLSESERKATKIIKESEAKLKELIATKDKFFNIVAHDLKNPFTSLMGSSELLYNNLSQMDPATIKKLALILYESAKGGYAILQNLLDWSRSQTGLLKISPEKINLNVLFRENISNLELHASNKNISFTSDTKNDIFINTDKNMLNTIIRNLLSNAIKFTHRNGKVTISSILTSHEVMISVKDTGIGIQPEKIDTLFRIDNKNSMPGTANEQGTGLGLKLSKEFVEKLGGKIWVESVENKGSEFKFLIPITYGVTS